MAVDTDVTEIADSEEEPLTSSPIASAAAVDKLSATALQDAQAVACSHQEPAGCIANDTSCRFDGLGADHRKALTDLNLTHIDGPTLQPTHQPSTNSLSTCAAEALPPSQASFDVAATDQRKNHVNLDGRASAPADLRIDIETAGDDHHLLEVSASSPIHPAGSVAEQVSNQEECLQLEAVHEPRISEPAHNNFAHAVSNFHDEVQRVFTVETSQYTTLHAHGDALAECLDHDKAHEASVAPHIARVADLSERPLNPGNAISRQADVADPMDMTTPPAATDETDIHTETAQNDTLTALSSSHNGSSTAEPADLERATSPAAGSASPSGAEFITGTDRLTPKEFSPSMITLSMQSSIADREQEKTNCNAMAKQSTTDEKVSRLDPEVTSANASGDAPIAQKISDPVLHDSAMVVSTIRQEGPESHDSQTLGSTASESLEEPHSTSSQPSEPTPQRSTHLSPQEITLAELRAQKAALLSALKDLPAIQVLIEENQTSDIDLSNDDGEPTEADITAAANKIVKEHIKVLHEYNELKDVGQGLMGLIADQRGVRIVEVQDEFGIDAND